MVHCVVEGITVSRHCAALRVLYMHPIIGEDNVCGVNCKIGLVGSSIMNIEHTRAHSCTRAHAHTNTHTKGFCEELETLHHDSDNVVQLLFVPRSNRFTVIQLGWSGFFGECVGVGESYRFRG